MNQKQRAKLKRRMERRERLASLWLTRLIAFLAMFENSALLKPWREQIKHFLNAAATYITETIVRRAAFSAAYQKRAAGGKEFGCNAAFLQHETRATVRTMLGGAFRGALKERMGKACTLKARAEALLRMLKKRDLWVAHMARRLARGLTKFYSRHARVAPALSLKMPLSVHASLGFDAVLGEDLLAGFAPP